MSTELVKVVDSDSGELVNLPAVALGGDFIPQNIIHIKTDFSEKAPQFEMAGVKMGKSAKINIINVRTIKARPSAVYTKRVSFTQIIGCIELKGKSFIACVTFGGIAGERVAETVTVLMMTGGSMKYMTDISLGKEKSGTKEGWSYGTVEIETSTASGADLDNTIKYLEANTSMMEEFTEIKDLGELEDQKA